MHEFITGQLFSVVLSLSLSGALTGILIAVVRPLTGRYFSKKWNYYIWLLVVARLLIPFHFEAGFPGLPNIHAPASTHNTMAESDNLSRNNDRLAQPDSAISDGDMLTRSDSSIPDSDNLAQTDSMIQHENRKQIDRMKTGMWTAAAYIWLLGAVLTLLVKLLRYFRFQKGLKKSCTRICDSQILIQENVFCSRLQISKVPAVCESASVHSPMTIGLRKPVIFLPKIISCGDAAVTSCMSDSQIRCGSYSREQLQLILHHELIHVARRDLLYKWVYELLLCVHWFNPALHLIGRQIGKDCELSCDEAVLPELTAYGRQLYGNLLLDTAEQQLSCRQSAFSTTLLENRKDLQKRLDGILRYKRSTRFRIALSACVFAAMLTLSACSPVWIAESDPGKNPHTDFVDSSADNSNSVRSAGSSGDSDTPWSYSDSLKPDRSSDAWKVYDNDEMLAGKDISDTWYASVCSGGEQSFLATNFALFGSDSFVIAYADRDIDVQISSSFEIQEGKFKIIHVAPDNSVVTLNDTGADTTSTVTMKKGRNVLKMVGQGGKVAHIRLDYPDFVRSDFVNVFFSEAKEYVYQVKNGLAPAEKEQIINALYDVDEEDASELFHILLTSQTSFTDDELCAFLIYSDDALSGRYLTDALRDRTISPLSADAVSAIMPYLEDGYRAEVLMQLPEEDFYEVFSENIFYLDSSEIDACLTFYIDRGGTLTYTMYDELSPYLDERTTAKLDKALQKTD